MLGELGANEIRRKRNSAKTEIGEILQIGRRLKLAKMELGENGTGRKRKSANFFFALFTIILQLQPNQVFLMQPNQVPNPHPPITQYRSWLLMQPNQVF